MKRLVTWLVLGGLLAGFAVPAYVSIANGNLTGPVREQVIIWLLFAAPSFFATWVLVNAWWNSSGERLSTMDGPARLLAVAVSAMPDNRQEWAAAMQAELTEVQSRSSRWSFAADAARAALFPPRGSRLPGIAAAVTVIVLVVATFMTVSRAMPALRLFAVTFIALAGLLTFLSIARKRRFAPSPAIAAIVGIAVMACIAAIVFVLQRYPAASDALGPGRAVFLAVMMAGLLWFALRPPNAMMTSRRARWTGVGAGLVVGAVLLVSTGFAQYTHSGGASWLFMFVGPGSLLFLGALYTAGMDGSFRSGVQTAVWGATVSTLLTFSIWLLESMRWVQAGAGLLLDNDTAPNMMATNIQDAIFWNLIWVPVWGLPFGILGAAVSGWQYRGRTSEPVPPSQPIDLA